MILFFLCLAHVALCAKNSQTVNSEVVRVIDASTSIVKISTEIKVKDVGSEYVYIMPTSQAEHLAFIGVKAKGQKNLLPVSAPVIESNGDGNYTLYSIKMTEKNPTIKIVVVLTDILIPFPAEISQNDKQLVKLYDSHYYYSKYPTKTQKSSIKLASSNVESYTRKVPHSNRGNIITFGPYIDIEPEQWSSCLIHSQNHEPFAKLSTVQTDIEVSHWGSVSIEEVVELQHSGAKLIGGWSRFDYQMRHQEYSHGFRSLLAIIPGKAEDIFYRDQIGNISTSELRRVDDDFEMEIQPRFPIFGGWKTQFYIGYRVPTETMLEIDEITGRYKFTFDFYTIFEDVWVEDLEVKVALPEGCTDIQVELPEGTSSSWSKRYSYLDSKLTGGRPVLILKGKNLVTELDSNVVVTYQFNKSRVWVEPFMLVGFFFVMFMVSAIVSRMNSRTTLVSELASSTPKAAAKKD